MDPSWSSWFQSSRKKERHSYCCYSVRNSLKSVKKERFWMPIKYRISSDRSSRYFSAETSNSPKYFCVRRLGDTRLFVRRFWAKLANRKNKPHLKIKGHIQNTLRKVGHIGNNGSYLKKGFTIAKMGHTWKNGSHLENGWHMEKWVTLEKMGHPWNNG